MDGDIVSGSQVGGVAAVLIRWYFRNVCSGGGGGRAGMGGPAGLDPFQMHSAVRDLTPTLGSDSRLYVPWKWLLKLALWLGHSRQSCPIASLCLTRAL